MRAHRLFRVVWLFETTLLFASFIFLIYSLAWEYSTRQYLKGFSDAIVPRQANPEERIQAILDWMKAGPERQSGPFKGVLADRDPEETLNYKSLLQICGSATNAFVNLALSSGLRARRLLLVNAEGQAKHVDAEIWFDGHWIVVDPTFRIIMRGSGGALLTREQLADPQTLAIATQGLANYLPAYTFERTAYIRLDRVKVFGPIVGKGLDVIAPGWDGSRIATLVVERESFSACVLASALFMAFVLLRLALSWYASARLGIERLHFTERLWRTGLTFLKEVS
ncbi:MAG TPA: transglutaminase-like domain-containing protein [Candidatus Acidoferrales bacterium]|nr:transglutaminase-like domain-containing protein [Candidatus Acidoferrales bacterium]